MQRNAEASAVQHVQYNTDGENVPAHRLAALYRGGGEAGPRATYHCNHKYEETHPQRLKQVLARRASVPLVLFSGKDKGCTIGSFATTNKVFF